MSFSPNLYVIAGPNGAGKTTFAREFLPKFADCPNFVNVDLIASGLSPFQPQSAALAAGKLMLNQIGEFARRRESFGFETTLSGRRYLKILAELKKVGYSISLFFIFLPTVEMAIRRVKDRVSLGGHSVENIDIERRFKRGLMNFHLYKDVVDQWQIIDGSYSPPVPLAYGKHDSWDCQNFALKPMLMQVVNGL